MLAASFDVPSLSEYFWKKTETSQSQTNAIKSHHRDSGHAIDLNEYFSLFFLYSLGWEDSMSAFGSDTLGPVAVSGWVGSIDKWLPIHAVHWFELFVTWIINLNVSTVLNNMIGEQWVMEIVNVLFVCWSSLQWDTIFYKLCPNLLNGWIHMDKA